MHPALDLTVGVASFRQGPCAEGAGCWNFGLAQLADWQSLEKVTRAFNWAFWTLRALKRNSSANSFLTDPLENRFATLYTWLAGKLWQKQLNKQLMDLLHCHYVYFFNNRSRSPKPESCHEFIKNDGRRNDFQSTSKEIPLLVCQLEVVLTDEVLLSHKKPNILETYPQIYGCMVFLF